MVEHMLSNRPMLRRLMLWLDPLTHRLWGAHINRDTLANVEAAGFVEVTTDDLAIDVVKRIEARTPNPGREAA